LLRYQEFLRQVAPLFKRVFVLVGPQDYHCDVQDSKKSQPMAVELIADRIQGMCESFKNVQFLNRNAVNVDGVRLIGATLWEHVEANDFKRKERVDSSYRECFVPDEDALARDRLVEQITGIQSTKPVARLRTLRVADTVRWHSEDLAFIKRELSDCSRRGQPAVVLTHHPPSEALLKADLDTDSSMQALTNMFARCALASSAGDSKSSSNATTESGSDFSALKVWAFGTYPSFVNKQQGTVQFASNSHGVKGEKWRGYKPAFVLSLPLPKINSSERSSSDAATEKAASSSSAAAAANISASSAPSDLVGGTVESMPDDSEEVDLR